uniref:Uncharacterized protein n=1 Tax=Arundo donax TaxID=35708 RepID=A0A0A8YCX7_ARUDO
MRSDILSSILWASSEMLHFAEFRKKGEAVEIGVEGE